MRSDKKEAKKVAAQGGKEKKNRSKKEKQSRFLLFSIRNKIVLCFVIPIAFMIIIGLMAYQKAAEGMSEKFEESTLQTIEMATEYVDTSCEFIEVEGLKYSMDAELGKYLVGVYEKDPMGKTDFINKMKADVWSSQSSNPFINNIHIIPEEGIPLITTMSTSQTEGYFETYFETASTDGKTIEKWIDRHADLDTYLSMSEDEYIMSFQMLSQSKNACIIIDIKESGIRDFLQGLDMGEGSIVGFVTKNGREVICENLPNGKESVLTSGETVFWGQEFFGEIDAKMAVASEDTEIVGTNRVTYNGNEYLFIYSRSMKTQATVCAMVPMAVITSQAGEIKDLTVGFIIVACVIALSVGIVTVAGIQNNMKRISKKFGEVAKGDLTVQVVAKGRDEFGGLADSATHMIKNTKNLVDKVNRATEQLEISSKDVSEASDIINEYSKDITQAIDEINEGMTRQAIHAQECVSKTDILSNEIQKVASVVEQVEKLVDETEGMINKGMEIVHVLGERAVETTDITSKVSENIDALRQETEIIDVFVETITEISEQTNLLSLNASIEAARAGQSGRGFAVVAEEIRKLADDSGKAAGEISNKVKHISEQTMNSVESANQARSMVDLQTQAVEEVIAVFREMQLRMKKLVDGLKDIINSIESADGERSDTVAAVKNISEIIEETASSTETVGDVANKLLHNVENLHHTAEVLNENMDGLKSEISVFKI